ncbi:isoleucine--tRNA ligase [Candidatus Parcubacteria bacterium]|nr:isoleucine--tRNA ligase [Candidatus Parcubacteria bacterium]
MLDFSKNERKILKFWKERKIFEKLRKKNQGKKHWSFLDGPITANNPMGVHHAWGRTYKDVFQRYKSFQGFEQRFQNGFDCQGLWVEVEVEKELGFKTKKDIEKYGIAKFIDACKQRVKKYSKIQIDQSILLGQWMDWKNSYYTMSDENNYAIWHFLKKCWIDGLLYKGRDSVPWCPRCGTAISQHEILNEEYKEIIHKAVYFKLPIQSPDFKNIFFLVWTTTPWTIPANAALAINPDFKYGIYKKGQEKLILSKSLAEKVLGDDFKLEKELIGKKLIGLKYKGPFDSLERVQKAKKQCAKTFHTIVADKDLVTAEEGTGIVHIAPGCGQEDFKLGKEKNLPVIDVINGEAFYLNNMGSFSNKNAKENPEIIFDYLKKYERGKFFYKMENYTHRYPTCWRCKTELVWRVVDEWYISMEKLRKPLAKTVKQIKWLPSFGLDRELDWLKNMSDWLISKKRYWGLALPIFECKNCGNFEVIGSKKELKQRAIKGWQEFEGNSPHKPWIDKVKIKCSKCGKIISRIPDVGNPWLDAGIVPFSTMKYFTEKNYWQKWFPVNFICESFPGQFKNWFYSLLVMSQVLEDRAPVKTIFGFATVVDEKGEEMHKSKGNAIWFDEAVEKIGADTMRWMYVKQNPAYNLRFGYKIANETQRKLLTLWNSFTFFETYTDKRIISINQHKSAVLLDRWIISKLNGLIEKVTKLLDRYNAATASLSIEKFFIEDLSLWYIRRSRKRFQKPRSEKEKKDAAETLYFALLNLTKLIAPMTPFLAEEIYLNLKNKTLPESVHLEDWPKPDKKKIDRVLEEKMKRVREIVALGLKERARLGIKVRQPLGALFVRELAQKLDKELLDLIKQEINVEKIVFNNKIKKKVELDTKITPKLREQGQIREIIRNIQEMRKKTGLKPKDRILIRYFGTQNFNKILLKNKDLITAETKAKDFILGERPKEVFDIEKEIKVGAEKLWLAIKKL